MRQVECCIPYDNEGAQCPTVQFDMYARILVLRKSVLTLVGDDNNNSSYIANNEHYQQLDNETEL